MPPNLRSIAGTEFTPGILTDSLDSRPLVDVRGVVDHADVVDVDGLLKARVVPSPVIVMTVMDRFTEPSELHEHKRPRAPVYPFPHD
jgi:hypothetical protein